MVATHTSHKSHEVCSRMTNRPPQGQAAAYKPKVHVRGRDSGLSLGISACQQRCRACVPAHRQAAVGQASCAGAVGKLQGQGLCGWPLCATRGSRVGLASCLAASAAWAATSSCCAVAFSALCAAAAVCSAAAAKSAAGRTGWAARSASLAFTPRAQHLPPPQPHTGNDHAQQACRASS